MRVIRDDNYCKQVALSLEDLGFDTKKVQKAFDEGVITPEALMQNITKTIDGKLKRMDILENPSIVHGFRGGKIPPIKTGGEVQPHEDT